MKKRRAKTLEEYKQKLSPSARARIEARIEEFEAQEMTLRELRKRQKLSQEAFAEILGWRQGDVSKFERKGDAYLSTIKRYIESLGAKLELIAIFPDNRTVKITKISEASEAETPISGQLDTT